MKLLEINSVCKVTSTGRIAADIYDMAIENKIEALIAYGEQRHSNITEGINVYRIGTAFDNYIHAFMTRITDKHGLYSKTATKKLLKKIDEFSPDIIHIHNIHGYYLNYEMLFDYLKKHNNIRVFWTLHDCFAFTGHCVYFSEVGCERYKTGCFDCPLKNTYPSSKLLDNSKNNYSRKKEAFCNVDNLILLLPSKWLENKVKNSFLKDYETKVIYNGVDHKIFRSVSSDFRQRYGLEGKKIILGVANVWSDNKGLKYYLEMAKAYKEAGNEDVRILIVGRIPNSEYTKTDNVLFINHTDSVEELAQIYSASDYYVSFSSEETFGMTVVEAMACGTYPIVMKDTACEEVVSGAIGSVCDRSAQSVIQEIETLSERDLPGRDDISRYALTYTKEAYVSNILDLYRGKE